MKYKDIRILFKTFFSHNGYTLHSASKVNCYDGDTLFTIAGMKQFKHLYMCKNTSSSLMTIQPCIRVNDLESIKYSNIHSSLFEMMGVFSFTNVNKQKVIQDMLNFFIHLGIKQCNLIATTHIDDDESYDIWVKLLGKNKVLKLKSNFWSMGEYGVCGPCTEVYYNVNDIQNLSEIEKLIEGGDTSLIEIGNSVFMSYNNTPAGMEKINETCLDMGIGLGRIACVLNKSFNVYKTDIKEIYNLLNQNKVVTDRIITSFWIMKEGVVPGATGRSYVLRKLLRSVFLVMKEIPIEQVLNIMSDIYEDDNFIKQNEFIINNIKYEIDLFNDILNKVDKLIKTAKTGKDFAILYHTYGVPLEIIQHYITDKQEKDLIQEIDKHKEKSKIYSNKTIDYNVPTKCIYYDHLQCESKIVFIEQKEDYTLVVTEKSCFYPQGGGQVGDQGTINDVKVINTIKKNINFDECVIIHECEKGPLKLNDIVVLKVNQEYRNANTRAHSGLHLLGEYIMRKLDCKQQGSNVCDDKARIDVTASKASVEAIIDDAIAFANKAINEKIDTIVQYVPEKETVDSLKDEGGYGDIVRVVKIPKYSNQLCGGTHVQNTKDIGKVMLHKIKNIGKGITRIIILTGVRYNV